MTHEHIVNCYKELSNSVQRSLQTSVTVDKMIQGGPYPNDIGGYLRTLGTEKGRTGMSLRAEIKGVKLHRQGQQEKNKEGQRHNGYSQVEPSEEIKETLGKAGRRDEGDKKARCNCPHMGVPTKQAVANLAAAIAGAVYGDTEEAKEAAKRIEKEAVSANAAGGIGLYATKSRNENATQILVAVATEARKSEGIDVVILTAEGPRQVGSRERADCLVIGMSKDRWPRIGGIVFIKGFPESLKYDQYDLDEAKLGDTESQETIRRDLYKKGLIKPYLKRSKSINQHSTIAADMVYAMMGRPRTKKDSPIIKEVAAAIEEKIGEQDCQQAIEDEGGKWLADLLELTRDTIVHKFGGKGGKDCANHVVNKAVRTNKVMTYHRQQENWQVYSLKPVKKYVRICETDRGDSMEYGREFASGEHVECAYFMIGLQCTTRYAYLGAEKEKAGQVGEESQSEEEEEEGESKKVTRTRNAFQYYLPLHQLTPMMKDVTDQYEKHHDDV